jgi:lipoprotein-anchoring transpeptidase ErfK/SrfK
MNERFIESRKDISRAREALKNGNLAEARQWAEHAAELSPKSEDPWLILAAVVGPRESMEYLRKALEVNPKSPRAKKGMDWAMQKLGETPKAGISSNGGNQPGGAARSENPKKSKQRSFILPILLILVGCAVFAFAAWSAATSPALASILNISPTPQVESKPPFAQVNIAKPTAAASQPMAQVVAPTTAPSAMPTEVVIEETPTEAEIPSAPTSEPTLEAVILPTETQPEATSVPGAVSAEIVADTPTPEFTAPTAAPDSPPQVAVADGEHWIDVDLSQQRLYAYAGDTLMNSFLVSTGTWQTPTVTGQFHIWIKLRSTTMTGPGYYLPNVPFTMYFYKDYGLHGTYWHNNFGTPMSHGCVNLATPDAEWLYNFSSVGTLVNVHE